MFKRNHYEYTCPDVIHDRNRNKRINRLSIGLTAAAIAGTWIAGYIVEKKADSEIAAQLAELPTDEE